MTTPETNGAPIDQFEKTGQAIAASRPDLLSYVSQAQQRVLELLLSGMTEPQIAERIGRSRHTVHDHTKAIYASLRVSNRVQLVLMFSVPAPKATTAVEAQPVRSQRLASVIPPAAMSA